MPTSAQSKRPAAPRHSVGRLVSGGIYKGYRVVNHGYHAPDRRVWWEAQNLKTGEADFHAHTLSELRRDIDSANTKGS